MLRVYSWRERARERERALYLSFFLFKQNSEPLLWDGLAEGVSNLVGGKNSFKCGRAAAENNFSPLSPASCMHLFFVW